MRRRRLLPPRQWDYRYADHVLDTNEHIENEGEYAVMIMPPPDLQSSVLATLKAKFGDLTVEGTFGADGKITTRFDAEEVE